mmetsp:Transcript_2101/g.4747  ORF Transcript_2101/g.4747 Transcript_2101/m.4747 type:complete len:208 (-) Transcript_2101:522-1145(-)
MSTLLTAAMQRHQLDATLSPISTRMIASTQLVPNRNRFIWQCDPDPSTSLIHPAVPTNGSAVSSVEAPQVAVKDLSSNLMMKSLQAFQDKEVEVRYQMVLEELQERPANSAEAPQVAVKDLSSNLMMKSLQAVQDKEVEVRYQMVLEELQERPANSAEAPQVAVKNLSLPNLMMKSLQALQDKDVEARYQMALEELQERAVKIAEAL